jgi:hypothetical protein
MRGPGSRDHRRVAPAAPGHDHGAMHRIARVTVLCALLAAALWPTAAQAADIVRLRGACTGPSSWRLVTRQLDPDKLVVRVEISGGASGQEWSMFVTDNGEKVVRNVKTSGADGFVRWVRQTQDRGGLDLVEMSGLNRSTGEVCAASLSFPEN